MLFACECRMLLAALFFVALMASAAPHEQQDSPSQTSLLNVSMKYMKQSNSLVKRSPQSIDGEDDLTLSQVRGKLSQFRKLRDYFKRMMTSEDNEDDQNTRKFHQFAGWVKELEEYLKGREARIRSNPATLPANSKQIDQAKKAVEAQIRRNSGKASEEMLQTWRTQRLRQVEANARLNGNGKNRAWWVSAHSAWTKEHKRLTAVYNAKLKVLEPLAESIKRLAAQISVAQVKLDQARGKSS